MRKKFAILVAKTLNSLNAKKITCELLEVLVEYRYENEVFTAFEETSNLIDLFLKLKKYWSFFHYELLGAIIDTHCAELKPDLCEYITHFKRYCEHRLCELPQNIFITSMSRCMKQQASLKLSIWNVNYLSCQKRLHLLESYQANFHHAYSYVTRRPVINVRAL